jgi:hypothetical protein
MLKGLTQELRIRWRIWSLERGVYRQVNDDSLSQDRVNEIVNEWAEAHEKLDRRFLSLITRKLKDQAEFWTIDLPNEDEQPDWWEKPVKGTWQLSHRGVARAKKLIRTERRHAIKWWVDLLVPILALLVALAAILMN